MENTNPELVHLLLDTGHIKFAGGNPLKLAQKYAHRIKHVHLKDIRESQMEESDTNNYSFKESILTGIFNVPGDPEGSIDFEPIFDVLAGAKYEGWLVVESEQDPAKAEPLVYAKMARAYLKKVIGF